MGGGEGGVHSSLTGKERQARERFWETGKYSLLKFEPCLKNNASLTAGRLIALLNQVYTWEFKLYKPFLSPQTPLPPPPPSSSPPTPFWPPRSSLTPYLPLSSSTKPFFCRTFGRTEKRTDKIINRNFFVHENKFEHPSTMSSQPSSLVYIYGNTWNRAALELTNPKNFRLTLRNLAWCENWISWIFFGGLKRQFLPHHRSGSEAETQYK